MRTYRRHRRSAPLAGSALLLAAALTLTACQTADTDGAGEESENTANASASPSGSGEAPSSGSGAPGDGGSEAAGPSDAEISASALPDHLQPPSNETTQVMVKAAEKGMGRPVDRVEDTTVANAQADAERAVDMFGNADMTPMADEACRETVVHQYEVAAASDVRSTRLHGSMAAHAVDTTASPSMPTAVEAPYRISILTYDDAAAAQENVDATLAVAGNEACAGEPALGLSPGGEVTEHDWGQGTRYTAVSADETRAMTFVSTLAVDGTRVIEVVDTVSGADTGAEEALAAQAKTVDLMAEALGEPVR